MIHLTLPYRLTKDSFRQKFLKLPTFLQLIEVYAFVFCAIHFSISIKHNTVPEAVNMVQS